MRCVSTAGDCCGQFACMEWKSAVSLLLLLFVGALLLRGVECQKIPRRCNKTLSSAGEYEQTPITLFLLRCSAGGILWKKTRHDQIVTFFRSRKPFTLCLGVELPGANVYRLDGPSRQLIAASNVSGTVGCFESRCGHASFLFEADSKTKVRYAYSFTEDAQRCPRCTDSCLQHCVCTGEYAFIGKVEKSKYASGKYTHYFRLAGYAKYDNSFNEQFMTVPDQLCSDYMNKTIPTIPASVPGLVKVYSKCSLKTKKVYFAVAKLHTLRQNKQRLVLSCANHDARFAQSYLENLLLRQQCCKYY